MTLLRKLTILIIIIVAFFIFFLIIKKNEVAIILIFSVLFFAVKWYQLMIEELIVYKLFSHGKMMKSDDIIDLFGKKAISAMNRLNKKEVIKKSDENIFLKISSYKFSFTKWRPRHE